MEITIKKKDGETRFYYGKQDITILWMNFFSGLSAEDERKSVELFLKKYEKKLKKDITNE